MAKGYLCLKTGEVFEGNWIGEKKEVTGEVVFNTSMTGFEELLADPSHKGQILTFTYPLIGNGGIYDKNQQIHAEAVIAGELCAFPSHYQTDKTLEEMLQLSSVPALVNIDIRLLVKTIRKHGTVSGKITSQPSDVVVAEEAPNSMTFVQDVTVKKNETYGNGSYHVVLIDYGYTQAILETLLDHNLRVTIVPFNTSFDAIKMLSPDGILISNGPGNPMEMTSVLPMIQAVSQTYPVLGIGLGHELVASAFGAKLKKMRPGHRGGNYPVKDLQTGKVYMTAQNHGYEVLEESLNKEVMKVQYRNVNDRSVEGLKHARLPVKTVQFHPEARPGPRDTAYIFNEFYQQLEAKGDIYVKV